MDCEYVVICKNHKELKKKIKRAQHENKKKAKDIKKIYGQKHVSKWYRKLKVIFENNTIEQLIDILNIGKETLELRPHQWIIREQVIEMFNNGIEYYNSQRLKGNPESHQKNVYELLTSYIERNPDTDYFIDEMPILMSRKSMFNHLNLLLVKTKT